jgi:hypothetical protein
VKRLLVPSSALLWGLQLAFLSPALALILVNLYGATTAEVGWVLGIYNASGFVASLLLPAYADKKHDYLGPMLVCGALTLLLAVVLALVTSLPIATIALVVIGGPAGVGSSMLYAHIRHSGARPADIVNTRAIVSVAWVAGPPVRHFHHRLVRQPRHPARHRRGRRPQHRHHRGHDHPPERCSRGSSGCRRLPLHAGGRHAGRVPGRPGRDRADHGCVHLAAGH